MILYPNPINIFLIIGQVFDFLLVLDLEIKFMWKEKWSMVQVMYFINRYITVLDFILVCIREYSVCF